ncbi:hypothetical protein SAMD00019534_119320 [Acytostelium subglobosum LB1]|uniref:hypothetical protein n=1 Tax=Acytostelium subglobosum LB1 TaxID=1410327 RepID=UPI000644DC53|nr:hypothetical protein SAMD00019534_119320 [Acytostelium subglobosum LB1]GAM28756.1 hypothetical protein SAMD00019534_119320 [Acytostelium subglobosum LB1]|eukprot:XP_012748311.1 hypothetical protein SAMD00019534_119320 [Acytostelium subglobosum LB1]
MYGGLTKTYEYYAPILVGSPSQMFTVQIDTGSTALAIPDASCMLFADKQTQTNCRCGDHQLDNFYQHSNSMSSSKLQCLPKCKKCNRDGVCQFQLSYQDGSFINGDLVTDSITLAGLTVNATFGSIKSESMRFGQLQCSSHYDEYSDPPVSSSKRVRDGILGMAIQSLDPDNGDDIFGKIVDRYNISNSFSLCMNIEGGVLVLGGVDEQYNSAPMRYLPMVDSASYYAVNFTGIMVDDVLLNSIPLSNPSFDSFHAFISQLAVNYSHLPGTKTQELWYGHCYNLTEEVINQYPTVYLLGVDTESQPIKISIPPTQYLVVYNEEYCLGISPIDVKKVSILFGDVGLQGYNVHFNRHNRTIGFAPVSEACSPLSKQNISLSIVSGNNQLLTAGRTSFDHLAIQIKNNGSLSSTQGLMVEFTIITGDGTFHPSLSKVVQNVTDRDGVAMVQLSEQPRGSFRIRVRMIGNDHTNTIFFTLQGGSSTTMSGWLITVIVLLSLLLVVFVGLVLYKFTDNITQLARRVASSQKIQPDRYDVLMEGDQFEIGEIEEYD